MARLEFLENQCIPLETEIRRIARESDDVKTLDDESLVLTSTSPRSSLPTLAT